METTNNFNQPCTACGSYDRVNTFRLIPSNRKDVIEFLNLLNNLIDQGMISNSLGYPLRKFLEETKYRLQVKESCGSCNKYIRNAPQTLELIEKLNQKLEGVRCG